MQDDGPRSLLMDSESDDNEAQRRVHRNSIAAAMCKWPREVEPGGGGGSRRRSMLVPIFEDHFQASCKICS